MKNTAQDRSWARKPNSWLATAALAIAILAALSAVATQSAQAQTFTILHNFTYGQDGGYPEAGLVMARAGNLYGTASAGGSTACPGGCGTVFKLSPHGPVPPRVLLTSICD